MNRLIVLAIGAVIVIGGLVVLLRPGDAGGAQTLTIYTAASLTDVFQEIGAAFEAQNPNVTVRFNVAGSSTLATQIVEGAPADVFASANPRQMTIVDDAGFTAEPAQQFAGNALVMITPADESAITTPCDLAGEDVALVVASSGVPVRDYTDAVLDRLATDCGADFPADVIENIVSEEANVRQVAARIAFGEGDAGIVYATDVTADIAETLRTVTIPVDYNIDADYRIAPLTTADNPALAADLVAFVLSDAGQNTLETWGFIPLEDMP